MKPAKDNYTAGQTVFDAAIQKATAFAKANKGQTYFEVCFNPQTTGESNVIPDDDTMPWKES